MILSFVLALLTGELIFPTPNSVNGGTEKMFVLIFLTVGFKVVIEFILDRIRKNGRAKGKDGSTS